MTISQPFTFVARSEIDETAESRLFNNYEELTSAHQSDLHVQILAKLREQHQGLIVTSVPASNCNLTQFALAGNASIELDIETDSIVRFRGFVPAVKRGLNGDLGDAIQFAKYHYVWKDIKFLLYITGSTNYGTQFVLSEPREGETQLSHSTDTDALLKAIGEWVSADQDVVYVFDGAWSKDKNLWNQVQDANWDKVILDPAMKRELVEVAGKFFDSEDTYKQFGVPWKRGLIFYGPPGNGKTISVTTLMHTLYQRKDPIPSLYVKSCYGSFQCRQVFQMARNMAPCMLVMEDLENIVYGSPRSYFFNEIDGLESNNGILFVGTTNYLSRLDPGISKRPSRFDRKYLFPLPSNTEREQYCEWWRKKIAKNPQVDYPKKLVKLVAAITFGFSFAYLQEAFIATLLELARQHTIDLTDLHLNDADLQSSFDDDRRAGGNVIGGDDDGDDDDDDDDIDKLPFWRAIREQVSVLRDDLQRNAESEDAAEQEPGLLSFGKKYFESAFGGLLHGIGKYFQSDVDISGGSASSHLADVGNGLPHGIDAFPEMRFTRTDAGRKAESARAIDLPVLFGPTS